MAFLICALIRCTKADSIKVGNLFHSSCRGKCCRINFGATTDAISNAMGSIFGVCRRSICQSNDIFIIFRNIVKGPIAKQLFCLRQALF